VSKLTCSFGLKLFISSRIHCRAAPMPRVGESVDDKRVPRFEALELLERGPQTILRDGGNERDDARVEIA
jgi:hypothetical protein